VRRTPALIVGGGPAGATAAIGLAQAGLSALLIERYRETRDTLCGGFLSWTTIARLKALDVDLTRLGARRIERVVFFAGHRHAEARLPAPAAALSRRVLDAALLARAEIAGANVQRGVAVRGYERGRLRLDDGGEIAADHLIIATGKHDLRGAARPRHPGDNAIGLRWRLGSSPGLARHIEKRIELHLFRGGYAGLVQHEDGDANLCLAIRQSRFTEVGQRPDALLAALAEECPSLAVRLAAASSVGTAQAIANIPYGWRARTTSPGVYRVGDQAGVIPSLAGEGIAIAIASGREAAAAIAGGRPADRFQAAFSRRLGRAVPLATLLWRAAEHPASAQGLISAVRAVPSLAEFAARLTRVD
jgi:flavin-dependent dehydrogenase